MEDTSPTLLASTVLGLVVALAALVATLRATARPVRLPLALLTLLGLTPGALLLLVHHPELIDARIGTYKALYADIEPGMNREDVLRLVDVHYPPTSSRQRPILFADEPDALGFFMNDEGRSGPDCEGILLDVDAGRVTRKRYSRD